MVRGHQGRGHPLWPPFMACGGEMGAGMEAAAMGVGGEQNPQVGASPPGT